MSSSAIDEEENNEFRKWTLESILESLFRFLIFWEKDSKRIGILIRTLHHSVMYFLAIGLILVHTVLNSFIGFIIVYGLCFLIWLQHILTGGCIVNKIEQKLIGDTQSFVDPFLEIFHIPVTPETTRGVVIMGSSLVMFLLSLEFVSRSINIIRTLPVFSSFGLFYS